MFFSKLFNKIELTSEMKLMAESLIDNKWFRNCGKVNNFNIPFNYQFSSGIDEVEKQLSYRNDIKGFVTLENLFIEAGFRGQIFLSLHNFLKFNVVSNSLERYNRRKLISSYFSVTLSITLVLFLLGILGFLVLNTQNITTNFKEEMIISVFLKSDAKQADIQQLQKTLSIAEYSKSVVFVSKEEAAKMYSEQLGEDFISFLGDNPLQNSFDLKLKADFVTPEKTIEIKEQIEQNPSVSEVFYDKNLVSKVHHNMNQVSMIILIISVIFTIVAMLLINSSIRLSVYSKRFIIKTMQLVGATKQFIRRPFVVTNILLGLLGAVLACIGLLICLYYIDKSQPTLQLFSHKEYFVIVFGSIFAIGVFISWLSTYFAAQRFLNLHTDDLYY